MNYDIEQEGRPMLFEIEPRSPKAIWRQITDRVKLDIASGALRPGDRLPPIRDVAASLRVNRNTVARAYQELERDGIITSRAGTGSFVADSQSDLQMRERLRVLDENIKALLVEAFHFQIEPDRVIEMLRKRMEQFQGERK